MYEPGTGSEPVQLHDLNPSQPVPTGLFWTVPIPMRWVDVDLRAGTARLRGRNIPVLDHHAIPNALTGMGPPPEPATVSFDVEWQVEGAPVAVRNTADRFAAELRRGTARMEWTARVGDLEFVSAPLATSTSSFAEMGSERNGVFMP